MRSIFNLTCSVIHTRDYNTCSIKRCFRSLMTPSGSEKKSTNQISMYFRFLLFGDLAQNGAAFLSNIFMTLQHQAIEDGFSVIAQLESCFKLSKFRQTITFLPIRIISSTVCTNSVILSLLAFVTWFSFVDPQQLPSSDIGNSSRISSLKNPNPDSSGEK